MRRGHRRGGASSSTGSKAWCAGARRGPRSSPRRARLSWRSRSGWSDRVAAMVDLTDCDREPIHIPGMIQPFGVLFVLAEPSLTVTQVSENLGDHLPLRVEEVLGQPLSTILDPASVFAV